MIDKAVRDFSNPDETETIDDIASLYIAESEMVVDIVTVGAA